MGPQGGAGSLRPLPQHPAPRRCRAGVRGLWRAALVFETPPHARGWASSSARGRGRGWRDLVAQEFPNRASRPPLRPRAHRNPPPPPTPPTGWRLDVLEPPQDAVVRAGGQARFSCTLSEAVPVGEATWYINGAAVQPDDPDWMVTADGVHHALLLRGAQPHHAGEVTFAARDAVASARLTVLGEWLGTSAAGRGGALLFQPQGLPGLLRGPLPGGLRAHSLPGSQAPRPLLAQTVWAAEHSGSPALGTDCPTPTPHCRIRSQAGRLGTRAPTGSFH